MIDWKQGLASALGAPILILPSIGFFTYLMGASAIFIWIFSVIQGTLQNVAYAELATMFPNATGIPGYAQAILCKGSNRSPCLRFIGGLSAWGYLVGWGFVPAIFALQITTYLTQLVPVTVAWSGAISSLVIGGLVFLGVFLVNYRGLGNSAKLAYLLALVSLIPLFIITIAPLINGAFKLSNITTNWLPVAWKWDPFHLALMFGIFGMAEWSACASEAAAVYGPEYKKPGSDLPKALFACGVVSFFTYSIVQASATGTLGVEGILAERLSPLLPLAKVSFGPVGTYMTIAMLIAAMVLLIQMASLTASRTMYSMSISGNLPKVFARTNKYGTPVIAMMAIVLLNLVLILVGSPEAIVAASCFGYMLAHGVTLFSYVKAKRDANLKNVVRSFRAPAGWIFIALFYGLFTLPLCFIGLIFLNGYSLGWLPTFIGFSALAAYVPLWLYSRKKELKNTFPP